ncbi:MAG: hypothetical protein ACRDU5_16255 [Mycobacterium sp.]
MQVVAFAPASSAVVDENGGVNIDGFPLTSCHIDHFPKRITIPLVLAAYTQGGTEYDLCRYIVAKSPDGERLGTAECTWHWPDQPGAPVKFWVLTRNLPIVVQSAGLYSVGLYDSPDATQTDHLFPLPVVKFNPLIPPRP